MRKQYLHILNRFPAKLEMIIQEAGVCFQLIDTSFVVFWGLMHYSVFYKPFSSTSKI